MNRYPFWKYLLIIVAFFFGVFYTLPNYFGESPAIQISSEKATVKVEPALVPQIDSILKQAKLQPESVFYDTIGSVGTIRVRFNNTDDQFKAKALLDKSLNTDSGDSTYVLAFNLQSNTPRWMQDIHALPMNLGLDLRGGVYFQMQVDTQALVSKRLQGLRKAVRGLLRDKNVRYAGLDLNGEELEVKFRDEQTRKQANEVLAQLKEAQFRQAMDGQNYALYLNLNPTVIKEAIDNGVQQNMQILSNRVNELGVSEPVIQRQGVDRIIVQLPGVQDVARAKSVIGRTATLEVHLVDESIARGTELTSMIPYGSELFKVGHGSPVVVLKDSVISGDYISSAVATFDENHQPAVAIDLNGDGGRRMREATRSNIGRGMAIVLFENGKGEVLTVATIRSELGSHFQITGMASPEAANNLALLLRAGSLAAPMNIIEEKTIGPALGANNIKKGFDATLFGFAAVTVFMIAYYMLFGVFSSLALAMNVLLLVALLSLFQATLTLPGIAAIALALGMAIDSNVLVNERIREELRKGNTPQAAISEGFKHAWATILDSNVTTLIVGLALIIFGSGPIRGFAVVHCLGILTSMFSAVFVSRGMINLWYGGRKKLKYLGIGQVWKPKDMLVNSRKTTPSA